MARTVARIFGVDYPAGDFAPAIGAVPMLGGRFEADLDTVPSDVESQAILCNVREDDRVSGRRAQLCVNGGDVSSSTGAFVRNALLQYHDSAMRG